MSKKALQSDLQGRGPEKLATDKAAVEAIMQMAVNVELFTIPLYMATMYSIQGMHQITGANNLYEGRLWPGLAPSFRPGKTASKNIPENEKAFNTIFSVFIEEMLHLQMASNLATVLGVVPQFTQLSPGSSCAWTCYGNDLTVIPGIVDFKDCKDEWNGVNYSKIRVKLDELNLTQNDLFLAIEAPEAEAEARLKDDARKKYFPTAPFDNWQAGDELPMFGSIGQMYQCLWDYLQITYTEGPSLFESMYSPGTLQRDLFNTSTAGHPYREYQGIETTVSGWLPDAAKKIVFKLICAITDQGEGNDIKEELQKQHPELKPAPTGLLTDVKPVNQASNKALQADYPSYNDKGEKLPPTQSTHAYARTTDGAKDHYERFEEIRDNLNSGKIVTWPTWHKTIRPGKNKWKAEDLVTDSFTKDNYNLPAPADIAGALNRLNDPDGGNDEENVSKREANYNQFCQIATGAIAGITSVLNDYWKDAGTGFPFPSMGGSGDRLMMCWAVFGQLPDLSVGIKPRRSSFLYHACQGMDLNENIPFDATCASIEVYHNCRGSNSCKAEGGCGFVQQVGQSKSCGSSVKVLKVAVNLCPGPGPKPQTIYSAPADNICKSFGGCAVPISASQIFPLMSTATSPDQKFPMELNDFVGPRHTTTRLDGTITFQMGELVYDKAWEAYTKVLESRKATIPDKPKPSDIRIAFPPST